MSAASSGVPRLEGLARVVRLVGAPLLLVGIRLDVVPAGAPISNWNCSSGKFVRFILVDVLGWGCYLCSCSSRTQSHYATATFDVINYD